jgi:hypothetical protein
VSTRKTLYDVLEVAHSASPATIDAAYKALCASLGERQGRDPEGAAVARSALEEAYRTLSNEHLRKRYDARIAFGPVQPGLAFETDERSWIARHMTWLLLVGAAAVGAYGYHSHVQKERAAAAAQLREKEELLARQQTQREEAERRSAEAEAVRKKRIEDARYQVWVDQTRRESAAHSRRLESERVRAENEAVRQQRMEELAKQREEAQARARLEQEKQNYGYRRY